MKIILTFLYFSLFSLVMNFNSDDDDGDTSALLCDLLPPALEDANDHLHTDALQNANTSAFTFSVFHQQNEPSSISVDFLERLEQAGSSSSFIDYEKDVDEELDGAGSSTDDLPLNHNLPLGYTPSQEDVRDMINDLAELEKNEALDSHRGKKKRNVSPSNSVKRDSIYISDT